MKGLERKDRNKHIRELRKKGLDYRQLQSVTGLTRQHLWRILKDVDKSVA